MKILVILAASTRGGIDFFQSLLDKHPEISQLPGEFYVDEFLQKIKKNSSAEIIANKFIEMHQRYFDSSISITERHNSLGPNKNQSYKVDKKLFIKFFLNFLKKKKINTKNIIIYLHLAYSKASGEDIKKKKLLVIQIHHLFRINYILNINFKILCLIRDPLSSHNSYIKNLAFYKTKIPNPWQFYFHINRLFFCVEEIVKLKKKLIVLRLEDLHLNNKKIMKKFCKVLNLRFKNSLLQSTFHNLLWWGDKVSKKNLNGVNKKFTINIDKNNFFTNDILVIENYASKFIERYSYEYQLKTKEKKFIKYLPFKFEILTLKLNLLNLNVKGVFFSIYYYFKRLVLMYIKKRENIMLPKKF